MHRDYITVVFKSLIILCWLSRDKESGFRIRKLSKSTKQKHFVLKIGFSEARIVVCGPRDAAYSFRVPREWIWKLVIFRSFQS